MVPVLFQNSLQQSKDNPVVILDNIFGVEPMKIVSPATDSEVAIALRVLEGCCLLHSSSAALAHKHKAIEVDDCTRVCEKECCSLMKSRIFIDWNFTIVVEYVLDRL